MTVQVNLGNRKRKELAGVVGGILGATPSYKGTPDYTYDVGSTVIDRDGTITLKPKRKLDTATTRRLMEGLQEHGFAPRLKKDSADTPVSADDNNLASSGTIAGEQMREPPGNLVIRIPLEGFDAAALENIRLLVDSKATLIRKALGVEHLPIEEGETTLDFPWFSTTPPPQEMAAYTNFVTAMCDMAKRQKRVLAVEKPTDNEKFVFRLFLVRLGLIGDEYADTRRILLRNLPGNGSCKNIEGKSIQQQSAKPDTVTDFPDFMSSDDPEIARQKISFMKRLGYFLLHFDE